MYSRFHPTLIAAMGVVTLLALGGTALCAPRAGNSEQQEFATGQKAQSLAAEQRGAGANGGSAGTAQQGQGSGTAQQGQDSGAGQQAQSPTTAQRSGAGQQTQSSAASAPGGAATTTLRGKKLVLKDGSFQLVREYQKTGDRVRYFSTERGQWEEIPAALVDWDATKKAETTQEKTDDALFEKVKNQEAATHANTPIDVDASLTVARGVFLPDGEGMFAVEGKSVKRIEQAGSQTRTDKKTVLKQVLTPVPIIPSKHNVEIPGTRANTRLTTGTPEFFLREIPTDAERDSAIERSSRVGDTGPDVVLMQAKVKGNHRVLESIRSMFGQEIGEERKEISIQRWDVAPNVFRFTLSQQLPPGEYALAELLPGGLNLFVWDFAVDPAPTAKASTH